MDGVSGEQGVLGRIQRKTDVWMDPQDTPSPIRVPQTFPRDCQPWLGGTMGDIRIWGPPGIAAMGRTQVTVTLWGHKHSGKRCTETPGGHEAVCALCG